MIKQKTNCIGNLKLKNNSLDTDKIRSFSLKMSGFYSILLAYAF